MRSGIRNALRSLDAAVEQAIRRELAKPFELGHSGRLQFEIDPVYYDIRLVQTEETVVQRVIEALTDDFLERAEVAGLGWIVAVSEEVVRWFADRWQAAGGPSRYHPAYAFFHGGLGSPRYDLEQRRWCEAAEVWPE
jgi:hypothetical protein